MWDDDAWDLIQQFLKVDPKDRLGAGCFEWIPPPKEEVKHYQEMEDKKV